MGVVRRCVAAAVVLAVSVTPTAGALAQKPEPAFGDVPADAWFEEAVDALAAEGVFAGTECDEGFCPDRPLVRWEMAVWLIRALGETDPNPATTSRFEDVSDDDWWVSYVERLAELEITVGCLADPLSYCPGGVVTRAQMASLLARALDLPAAEPAGFDDVADGSVHRDDIDRLAAAEITVGCASEPLQYCPEQPVTRAEMSVFIHRGLKWRQDNPPADTQTTGPPTPVLISNDTDEFITEENELSRHIRDNVVAKYEHRQPWLRDAWNHTNRADFTYIVGPTYTTAVYYGNRIELGEELPRSTAIALAAHPEQVSRLYDDDHVHELAHVYTVSNRVVAYPAPIAAGHIYFSEIAQGGGKSCRTYELYAETAETLLFNRYATYTNWFKCTTVAEKPTDEAIEVVSQAFSGRMPQWFYDTFYDPDGNPDHRAIWAAIGRIRDGRSQLAAINQLRYSYGGYCSEADVWEFSRQNLDIEQPWRDGGCDD